MPAEQQSNAASSPPHTSLLGNLNLRVFSHKYIFNRFIISELMLLITVVGMVLGWLSSGNISESPPLFFFLIMAASFFFQVLLLQMLFRLTSSPQTLLEKLAVSAAEIESEKAKISTILSSIGDGVFAVDKEGKILLMNQVAELFCGQNTKDVVGKYYNDIFSFYAEDAPGKPYPKYVEESMKTGQLLNHINHTNVKTHDGKVVAIADNYAPIKDDHQNIIGCVVVFRDMTRQREMEKTRNTFFSITSHELRTPLGSIRWSLEMVKAGEFGALPPSLMTVIDQIKDSTMRMIDLVNNLLDVSRVDQEKLDVRPEVVQVKDTVESVLKEMESVAEEKHIHMQMDHPVTELPTVKVDPKLFREVVSNLISNAIKYSLPNTSVQVGLKLDEQNIHFTVADHGIGIPEVDQQHLFTRFFRAQNAQLTQADGSGLGLYVVKSYVESWNGKVWVESPTYTEVSPDGKKKKSGSTFHVLIPKTES